MLVKLPLPVTVIWLVPDAKPAPWQDAVTLGLKAKHDAVSSAAGTVRVALDGPSSQTPSRAPWPHHELVRWKSSSGLDPTGDDNAHAVSAAKMRTAVSPVRANFARESSDGRMYILGAYLTEAAATFTSRGGSDDSGHIVVRSVSTGPAAGREPPPPGTVGPCLVRRHQFTARPEPGSGVSVS